MNWLAPVLYASAVMLSQEQEMQRRLLSLPEEERDAALKRQRERREVLRLEASEEVRLAREGIAAEGLRGEFAEQLIAFARRLAARRMN